MLELNNIYNCDCLDGLKKLDDNSIDLVVTSPPYDTLRTYHNTTSEDTWNFETFKPIANELYRVLKPGCCVVWVVGDAVNNGGETGSSFRQALYFQEIGFNIHDTMIYEKNGSSFPARRDGKRYTQIFEYMFVFVKGKKIRNDVKLICDKKNKWAGWTNWGRHSQYDADGKLNKVSNIKPIPEFSPRTNIWKYSVSFNDKTGHPAVFPEQLANDNILTWSTDGDVVLDPFMGSGTTAKMAMLNNRKYIGFEKNEDYYKKSLERIEKYKYKTSDEVLSGITIDGQEMLYKEDNFNEIEEKTKLFNSLVEKLNQYFNEQSLGILKTLDLTFKSESNEKRIKEISENNGFLKEKEEVKSSPIIVEKSNNGIIQMEMKFDE